MKLQHPSINKRHPSADKISKQYLSIKNHLHFFTPSHNQLLRRFTKPHTNHYYCSLTKKIYGVSGSNCYHLERLPMY